MAKFAIPASIKKYIPLALAVGITALFLILFVNRSRLNDDSFLTSLDKLWDDAKFRFRGRRNLGSEVVIVAIDDKTVGELGSARTFQRKNWAKLVDKLREAGPKAIGFDVFFSECEKTELTRDGKLPCEGKESVDQISDSELGEGDRLFAEAIKRAGNVVVGVVLVLNSTVADQRESNTKADRRELDGSKDNFASEKHADKQERRISDKIQAKSLIMNIGPVNKAAALFGFVNVDPDPQGRIRNQAQFIEFRSSLVPSLDIQLVRLYLETLAPIVRLGLHSATEEHFEEVTLGKRLIPLDQYGRLMINYDGPSATHETVSMIDVLKGQVPAEKLRGKIVLIGATAVGLSDVVATPFDRNLPGVELHANQILSILHENYLSRPHSAEFFDFALILIFGVVLGIVLPKLNAARSVVYTVLLFAAHMGLNVFGFMSLQWQLSFIYPGLALASISGGVISYKYLTEERERKRTKQTFQYYLDPNVVERVMGQPELLKLGGEKREMSVLFSDIRGFTSFSEKMTPDEVVHFLNQYFDQMTGLILKKEGCLDKLIGDAVMCFWGAPLPHSDHAVRATICGLEMLQTVEDLRPVLTLPGGARFEIGIGVNTGPMVVGNMGSHARFAYTVMGDNVNLGSRLEAMNKYYGTRLLISDATYEACKHIVYCRELDTIQVKGKSQAVTIYEGLGLRRIQPERRARGDRRGGMEPAKQAKRAMVLARHGERRKVIRRVTSDRLQVTRAQEELATAYANALAYYRRGNFDAANAGFDRVLALSPADGPSRLMKVRIVKYREQHLPSETFDPVYKFDEK